MTKNYAISYVGGTLTVEKVIRSYPLTFYADGAGETVSQQHDALSGSSLSAYADLKLENDPRRTFAGWSLEKNVTEYKGNETKVIDWDKFAMPEEPVSVYPVWVENQLNIRLDLGAYDAQNTQSWYDASKYDPATPAYMEAVKNRNFWEKSGALINMDRINAATRPGYALDGWRAQDGMLWDPSWKVEAQYCDRDSDGKVVMLEDKEYRNFYYILTLTAKWTKEPKKANVFYDLNGGTGEIVDETFYVVNDLLTIPSETPTPPEGKLFAGWLDKAGNLYHPGDSSIFASEDWLSERNGEEGLWLTAQYEDIPEPEYSTITFKTGGGSMVASITLQPGEAVTPPADPTRIGYTFAGWSPALPETMPDDDLTVTAQWTPNRYTITFDTGRGSPVTPMTQDFDTPIAIPANPVLTGYSFAGWDPALPEKMPPQDLTLKAVWTVNSYTITFDTDGGSSVQPLTNIYGAWIEVPENPTKSGYVFDGWDRVIPTTMPAENVAVKAQWKRTAEVYAVKQNADGTWADAVSLDAAFGDAYQITEPYGDEHLKASAYSLGAYADESGRTPISAGDSINLSDANGKLYLYYARDAFDLTIYADVAGAKVLKTEKVLYGASLSEYGELTLDDTDLYTFAGWTTDKNVTVYNADAPIAWDGLTMSAAPLEIYPILVTNYINVKLDLGADDAQMDVSQGRSFWKAADTGVLVNMERMNAATRPDYALDGWFTKDGTRWDENYPISLEYCDRDADGKPVRTYDAPYKNYVYTLTLTAKWKIDITANVVYDLNGGSGSVADSASYPFNSTVKVSETVPTPPDYKVFTGWLDSAGTLHNPGDSFDFSDMALRTIQDDKNVIALTAQYMTPGNVTITFDTDGGSAIAPITGDAGTPVTAPDNPVRTGYAFAGWDQPVPTAIPASDMTLKAKWQINRYTLTFDTGRGTEIKPVTQDYGTAVSVSDPTLTGYAFGGWTPELPETMPAENRTLTAKWTPQSYTLTFETNGGGDIAPITDIYGAWIAAPADPTKEGYAFDGWEPELPATMPAENRTLKAKWTQNNYTITFDTDGGSVIAPIAGAYGSTIQAPANPTKAGYTFDGWDREIPTTMPAENVTIKAKWKANNYTITFDTDSGSVIDPITGAYGDT
ncbi:MAG: InlB B-repeat-containing protein, partial [Oscillospiraceae bacterium]|nr:InlB B-repeat-containing protein [Oscillospiraceae bacterium]